MLFPSHHRRNQICRRHLFIYVYNGIVLAYFVRQAWFHGKMSHRYYKLHGRDKHTSGYKMRRKNRNSVLRGTRCLCAQTTHTIGPQFKWKIAVGVKMWALTICPPREWAMFCGLSNHGTPFVPPQESLVCPKRFTARELVTFAVKCLMVTSWQSCENWKCEKELAGEKLGCHFLKKNLKDVDLACQGCKIYRLSWWNDLFAHSTALFSPWFNMFIYATN